jgi:glycosyltransferase involved in cell wall biosynthesis
MALQLERSADRSSNPFKRLFWALEARAMRRYERKVFDWADAVTLISRKDLLAIQGVEQHPKLLLNPHGVATERYPDHGSEPRERDVVLFTGGLQFGPNQEGVLWFAREVFPLLKRAHANARFRIVGARPGAKILALADTPGIEVFRDVPSVVPYQVGASVGIVPIHSAGGLQNKLLEGLAAGLPMVCTSVGNEGLGAAPGKELLVADTASEFARAVGRLMTDGALADTLGAAGQAFVRRAWTWRAHFDNLEARLEELVASRGPSG